MKLILSDRPLNIPIQDRDKIHYIDLSSLKIANCTGCFSCWTKTPGRCIIRDDATQVYPRIAESDTVLYVSRLKYGSYDTVIHVQRAVASKKATIIAYGAEDKEEYSIFRQLVSRNAHNMNFEHYEILFTTESMVDDMVKYVLEKWEKS